MLTKRVLKQQLISKTKVLFYGRVFLKEKIYTNNYIIKLKYLILVIIFIGHIKKFCLFKIKHIILQTKFFTLFKRKFKKVILTT